MTSIDETQEGYDEHYDPLAPCFEAHPQPDRVDDDAVRLIVAMLAREGERGAGGDCNCINLSRDAEREYERYECPHQRARLWLASHGVLDDDYPHTFIAYLERNSK